ncbi:hypothetical protein LPTSP3_g23460 [Leptospira kobayashii]|uniref:Lipoprotein n=1 Tax=Leptospira kobayashii TaxID=1917830 RepID=A0ABN6KJS0_9LEPT|nr:hypothetical protein [Leptospira kobayashii]BDA79416.1 hypothetical protein LPTSP3_g23460 [Leptospira kobayashii]
MKKNFLILVLIFYSCVSTFIKERHSQSIPLGAVQKEVADLSKEVSKFSDINDNDRKQLFRLITVMCDVKEAKQINFLGYPQFELSKELKEKGKDIFCVWNYRKELIGFSMKTSGISDWELETSWFDERPTRIFSRLTNLGYVVERHWQWSIIKNRWKGVLVFLKIEDLKEGRIRTYNFSRYEGEMLKKEEVVLSDQKSVLDGWQFQDVKSNGLLFECKFYSQGKLSEDRKDCQLTGQTGSLPLEKVNFE